jgi:hypothetical protein
VPEPAQRAVSPLHADSQPHRQRVAGRAEVGRAICQHVALL